MKPLPPGWPRISSAVYYEDAAKAIDWGERSLPARLPACIRDRRHIACLIFRSKEHPRASQANSSYSIAYYIPC